MNWIFLGDLLFFLHVVSYVIKILPISGSLITGEEDMQVEVQMVWVCPAAEMLLTDLQM